MEQKKNMNTPMSDEEVMLMIEQIGAERVVEYLAKSGYTVSDASPEHADADAKEKTDFSSPMTIVEIEQAVQTWQRSNTKDRSAFLLTVRKEDVDTDNDGESVISGSLGGKIIDLAMALHRQMHNFPAIRRVVLSAAMAYLNKRSARALDEDDEEEEDD